MTDLQAVWVVTGMAGEYSDSYGGREVFAIEGDARLTSR